jgi:GNAT superfamily N-acetyltransferase
MLVVAGYQIDAARARVDHDALWAVLDNAAYWGRTRTRHDVVQQVATAWRVVGAYTEQGDMVGFARGIADGYDTGYLADVYVLPEHRGRGLAQALVQEMIDNGPGATFRWMLHTRDAHDLYRKFGFAEPDARLMERPSRLT